MDYHADKIIDLDERHAQEYVADRRRVRWKALLYSESTRRRRWLPSAARISRD
jgi:hypothetical protein